MENEITAGQGPRERGAFCAGERLAGRQVAGAGLPTGGLRAGACVGKRFADWRVASWRIAGRDERLASTRGRGVRARRLAGAGPFAQKSGLPATGWLVAAPPHDSRHRPTICNGFWKLLPKMTRVRVKPRLQAHRHREIAVRAPSLQRKSSNQGHIRVEQHTLAHFLAANLPDPLANNPSDHRPDPDPSPIIPRYIGPTQAPDRQPSMPLVQARPLVNSPPGHRPKTDPLPATFRTIGPTPDPLTNTLPRHRPGAGEPHGATPYCACATPSPSGAPTGQGPLPLCAQHHPSSIRS